MTHPDDTIPYGFCHCGCGQQTAIASRDDARYGSVKGEPRRFVKGHQSRINIGDGPNPSGLCMCGCGESAPPATFTNSRLGNVAGKPQRFILGHQIRKHPQDTSLFDVVESGCWVWRGYIDDAGYAYAGQFPERRMHRVFFAKAFGDIPDGVVLHHACGNKACVNPNHLQPMTQAEHMRAHNGHHH